MTLTFTAGPNWICNTIGACHEKRWQRSRIGDECCDTIESASCKQTQRASMLLCDLLSAFQYINISSIIYAPIIASVKLSILLQYLRTFVPSRQNHFYLYIGVHLCIWNCLGFYLADMIINIVVRDPYDRTLSPENITSHWFFIDGAFRATGIFNVLSDFAILLLPMPCLYGLQMPLKRRLSIMAIFGTGSL